MIETRNRIIKLRCDNLLVLSLLLDSLIIFFHMMLSGMKLIAPEHSMEDIVSQRFEAILDLLENGLYAK